MENNGFNVGKAMVEEGYSKNSAKNPLQVTGTKSWEMLIKLMGLDTPSQTNIQVNVPVLGGVTKDLKDKYDI